MVKEISYKELESLEKFVSDKKKHEKILEKFAKETDFWDTSSMRESRVLVNDAFLHYVNKLNEAKDRIRKRIDSTPLTKQERLEAENELEERVKSIRRGINSVCSQVQSDLSYKAKDSYVENTLGEIRDEKLKNELGWGIYDVICQESFDAEESMCRVFQRIGSLVAKAYKGGRDDENNAHIRRMEREHEKAKAKKQKKGDK